jgi:hypothetical protein
MRFRVTATTEYDVNPHLYPSDASTEEMHEIDKANFAEDFGEDWDVSVEDVSDAPQETGEVLRKLTPPTAHDRS